MMFVKNNPKIPFIFISLLSSLVPIAGTAYIREPTISSRSFSANNLASETITEGLPELGSDMTDNTQQQTQHLAEVARSIGQAIQHSDKETGIGRSTREWFFNQVRDQVAEKVSNEGEHLLSPLGRSDLSLNVDMSGNFTGTTGSLLTPVYDNEQMLTYSELVLNQAKSGTVGSAGLGQRWGSNDWIFGYNAFVDQLFDHNQQRASFGSELWSDYLRLSANYYLPLSGWRQNTANTMQQLAHGYDITSQGYLPFYQQLGVTLSWQQYLGDNIDLLSNGSPIRNAYSVAVGLTYTPVPLVTVSATHQDGSGRQSQEKIGLNLNYKFGQSLQQQLSPNLVADAHSLLGSRSDKVTRSFTPVMSYEHQKGLSVFLASPPWQLSPGDSVTLVVQASSTRHVQQIIWHGDTQVLSLTPPSDNTSLQGWSIIMPSWNTGPDATNQYRLSVTVDDGSQQATSETIILKPQQPIDAPDNTSRFNLIDH